jgi:DNA-binding NarL/FixJ family response regulator
MEKTFILGNSSSLEGFGGTFVKIPDLLNETKIHDLVVELFRVQQIDKIIVEIGENPSLSLQIGYHIRLSIENIKEGALIPIFYVSELSIRSIMLQAGIYSQILATKGVFFSEFNLQSNKVDIEHISGLNQNEYLNKFLKIIHIQPDETVGRHSLANIWGAYAMDKASNANALSEASEFKKKLYFKYVAAFNELEKLKPNLLNVLGNIKVGDVKRIKAEGKRVLLIDDEASNGWGTVLRKILKTSSDEDFVIINEKVKDFEAFSEESKRIIEKQKFDLYLVDLRLNGLEEDENLKTVAFSGMKVLKKIKSLNEGNQVIVFTASNKVWNLKALLDAGADGYYMKESPEYNFSKTISEQNYHDFKDNVVKSFDRSYLRGVFAELEHTKRKNNSTVRNFIAESNNALDIAWELIKRSYLDFGFLTLFQSIESISGQLYSLNPYQDSLEGEVTIDRTVGDESEWEWLMTYQKDILNGGYFKFEKSLQTKNTNPTTLYKVSCLFKIKLQKDETFLKGIGRLNKLRNAIAHGGTRNSATKNDLIEILKILGEIRSCE